jgi:hypothetical protein
LVIRNRKALLQEVWMRCLRVAVLKMTSLFEEKP